MNSSTYFWAFLIYMKFVLVASQIYNRELLFWFIIEALLFRWVSESSTIKSTVFALHFYISYEFYVLVLCTGRVCLPCLLILNFVIIILCLRIFLFLWGLHCLYNAFGKVCLFFLCHCCVILRSKCEIRDLLVFVLTTSLSLTIDIR